MENNRAYLVEQSPQQDSIAHERVVTKICEAINNAETFEEWINLAKQAREYQKDGVDISSILILVSIKSLPGLYKNCSTHQKDEILRNLQNLLEMQKLEIPAREVKNFIIDYALEWIEDVNDLRKFKEFKGEEVKKDPDTSIAILKIINQLEITEEKTQEKIKKLNEYFSVSAEPAAEILDPPVLITQRSQISMGPPIYVRNELNVNQCRIWWKGKEIDAVIKTYKELGGYKSAEKFIKEVEILRKLSGTSRFFLEFYGCFYDDIIENNVKKYCSNIVMEYCPRTLNSYLKTRIDENKRFTPKELNKFTLDLLEAFQSLVSRKIYHQDIKPDNILITNDEQIKIADFNVSDIKEVIESTYAATGVYDVIGTASYMAPELRNAYINGVAKTKYRPERADAFSLGLVLYQLATFDNILRFNEDPRNREKVLRNVELPWLRELLYDMLSFEYRERLSFRKALKKVNHDATVSLNKGN